MIPRWAIEAISGRFRAHFAADQNEKRAEHEWNQSFAKWVARDWNDPKRRPVREEPSKSGRRWGPPPIKAEPGAGPPPADIAADLRKAMDPDNMFGPQLPPERAIGDA